PPRPAATSVGELARRLAAQLEAGMQEETWHDRPCVVTCLADLDDLDRTSPFGRAVAEALGVEIFRRGGRVVDIRPGTAFRLRPRGGEFLLTRQAAELPPAVRVPRAVVGTYTAGPRTVGVTVRLVDLTDRRVVSAARVEVPRTPDLDALFLGTEEPPPTAYDRLPRGGAAAK
ncbi:hypothetical protein G3N55_10820, partial [Dissulfurirhabdus thermomarina]